MTTKQEITNQKIAAMKAKDSFRSNTLGSILAAIKQYEVDNQKEANPDIIISILNKMSKQRQESITQFTNGNRPDLSEIEEKELVIIKEFLPKQASEGEVLAIIDSIFSTFDNPTMKDMGKIMGKVKAELNGKADMAFVSKLIKDKLN